jgi:hypothetical protein
MTDGTQDALILQPAAAALSPLKVLLIEDNPLDARLIRVQDHRRNAQPTQMGRSVDGLGPDQAGWWIDMGEASAPIDIEHDPQHTALAELRRSIGGANVHMPEAGNIFEAPGPRWYRPWSPHLVRAASGSKSARPAPR